VGGQQDHRQAGGLALDLLEQCQAVHLVHAQVGEDQLGAVGVQHLEGLAAALGGGHAKPRLSRRMPSSLSRLTSSSTSRTR
jgi:hypothetical protein